MVVAIIAVLSGIVLVGLSKPQTGSRDERRVTDLTQVSTDLEVYFALCGFYPGQANCAGGPSGAYTWSALTAALTGSRAINVNSVPNDPFANSGATYYYGVNASGTSYLIAAKLESSSTDVFKNYVPPSDFLNYNAQGLSSCDEPYYCIEFLYHGASGGSGPPPPQTYNCVNNSCSAAGSGGSFSTLSSCIAVCGASSVQPPAITSALTASGVVGSPFTYTITATNCSSGCTYAAQGLPAGLSFDANTATISGTPSAAQTSNITISATNSAGMDSKTLVLTVKSASSGPGIQADFFSLNVHDMATPWPPTAQPVPVPFGSLRMWDTATRWDQIEPSEGTYKWATFDGLVNQAAANGQTVLYTFGGDPNWASSNPGDTSCAEPTPAPVKTGGECDAPSDVAADGTGTDQHFKDFVTALMQHLNQTGEHIKYFEVWNEVNNKQFWVSTAEQLVRMAYDARTIIKQFDPSAVVLTPDTCNCKNALLTKNIYTTTNPQDGMKYYLTTTIVVNGSTISGASVADGVTFHTYLGSPDPEGIVSLISKMFAAMQQSGAGSLPLIDTESSWGRNSIITGCPASDVPPFSQTCLDNMAAFVSRSYILVAANGVTRYYWYQWGNQGDSFGSLNEHPNIELESGQAYGTVESWLVGSSFAKSNPCPVSGSYYTCSLTSSAGVSEEIKWNSADTPATVSADGFKNCSTVDGSACTVSGGTVTIGAKPILLY